MSTVIRMKPGGRTHAPYYRVVVADSRAKITGSVIEELGVYHPLARPEPVTEINRERALEWLAKGAQPSRTVKNILSKMGIWAEFKTGIRAPVEEAAPVKEATPVEEAASEDAAASEEAPQDDTSETTDSAESAEA